jgi:hypothetical protein
LARCSRAGAGRWEAGRLVAEDEADPFGFAAGGGGVGAVGKALGDEPEFVLKGEEGVEDVRVEVRAAAIRRMATASSWGRAGLYTRWLIRAS